MLSESTWQWKRPAFSTGAAALLLALLVAAAFSPALTAEFIALDDQDYIINNPAIANGFSPAFLSWAFTSGYSFNWHPLTWISHAIDFQLYGLHPLGHHLSSLLLHLINALLLWSLFCQLSGDRWRSWLVAALFALHPLRVESVVWVSERKDLLCALFWIITVMLYTRYVRRPSIGIYLAMTVAFTCSLMAKPMAVTLPFLLLLLDYWPLERTAWLRPATESSAVPMLLLLREKLPLLILSLCSCIITFSVQTATIGDYPLLQRLANALCSYGEYIGKHLISANLAPYYPYRIPPPSWEIAICGILLLIISAGCLAARKREPSLAIGWFWFLGTLVPVIGLVQAGEQSMADRYTYLPGIGLIIMLVWGGSCLVKQYAIPLRAVVGFVSVVITVIGLLTFRQARQWHDSETLFRHTLAVTKQNYQAHYTLGLILLKKGMNSEALEQFSAAVRIKPEHDLSWTDLGMVLGMEGRLDEAVSALQQAIVLNPMNSRARFNLAVAHLKSGDRNKADHEYKVLLNLDPELAGRLSAMMGQ